jgi:hypothetical protein
MYPGWYPILRLLGCIRQVRRFWCRLAVVRQSNASTAQRKLTLEPEKCDQ